MKRHNIALIVLILGSLSCASLTRHYKSTERDTFLNILPLMNVEILGAAREEAFNGDLRTLHLLDYKDLIKYADLTSDYKSIVNFIKHACSEQRLFVNAETFIICFRLESHYFEVCDDASTPGADKVTDAKNMMAFDEFVTQYLNRDKKDGE